MRRETSEHQHDGSACYGVGTRVEVHRSRHELERVLNSHGAGEVLFVEADATASIQFELRGRYVQLALPLPDPAHTRFSHTPSGKPRTAAGQERAYEQALREHWRSLVIAVRGKLQSVESGISTFDQEFERFFVPHSAAEKTKRSRKAPKAVSWLLGGSHSVAIALVAASLVPASAVGAFALPTDVVGHLSAPFHSVGRDDVNGSGDPDRGLALARGGWTPASSVTSEGDGVRRLALGAADPFGAADGQVRATANLSDPPVEPVDSPTPVLAAARTTPLASGGDPPAPPSPSSNGNSQPPAPSRDDSKEATATAADETPAPPAVDPTEPEQSDAPDSSETPTAPLTDAPPPDEQPTENESPAVPPPAESGDTPGQAAPPGNGNGGTPPGQEKKDDPNNTPPGQAKKDDPANTTPPSQPTNPNNNPLTNGNGKGKAKGGN
jgi:hypothetical protein